jgi:plasmid maintenance system killer protein
MHGTAMKICVSVAYISDTNLLYYNQQLQKFFHCHKYSKQNSACQKHLHMKLKKVPMENICVSVAYISDTNLLYYNQQLQKFFHCHKHLKQNSACQKHLHMKLKKVPMENIYVSVDSIDNL